MLHMSFTHEETLIWDYTCTVCGKKFKIKWYMKKHLQKTTYLFLVPSQRYQDFCQLLQNLEFPKNVLGFSNHAQRFTPPYHLDVDSPFSQSSFSSRYSWYHKSQTVRARELKFWENVHPPQTCHMSCVTCHVPCHVSDVTCHVSHVTFLFFIIFGQSGEAYWWRVCYQWGLPCLV